MLDELAIYNLSVKYPNTIDLVREVERIAKAESIEEVMKECERFRKQFKSFYYSDFVRISEQLKEQNNGKR